MSGCVFEHIVALKRDKQCAPRQIMVLLNLWSLGHFVQWTFIGRFLLTNWWVFLALSVGWEVLELYLPFEFVEETWDNKLSDLVVNTVGFALGLGLRYDPQTLD